MLSIDFADKLYSFMALKYQIAQLKDAAKGGPPIEEDDWKSSGEFTVDIARSVMMLSFAYRTSYRQNFKRISDLLLKSELYPVNYSLVFAKMTYTSIYPLKVLQIFSFISELHLFMFQLKGEMDGRQHFIKPAKECFNKVYNDVLSKIFDPFSGQCCCVSNFAATFTRTIEFPEPYLLTELPSAEVVKAPSHGPSREGASKGYGSSSASAPSTSPAYNQNLADKRTLEADVLADWMKQTSLTDRDSTSGGEKPKSRSRKSPERKLATCSAKCDPSSSTTNITAEGFRGLKAFDPATLEEVDINQTLVEEVRFYQFNIKQSPNTSKTMPVETRADSSAVAKKKSKKKGKK